MSREHEIMAEQEAHIARTDVDTLIDECIERLLPILTHGRPVSTMRVPADAEHDDDLYVMMRLQAVKKRLEAAKPLLLEAALRRYEDIIQQPGVSAADFAQELAAIDAADADLRERGLLPSREDGGEK